MWFGSRSKGSHNYITLKAAAGSPPQHFEMASFSDKMKGKLLCCVRSQQSDRMKRPLLKCTPYSILKAEPRHTRKWNWYQKYLFGAAEPIYYGHGWEFPIMYIELGCLCTPTTLNHLVADLSASDASGICSFVAYIGNMLPAFGSARRMAARQNCRGMQLFVWYVVAQRAIGSINCGQTFIRTSYEAHTLNPIII